MALYDIPATHVFSSRSHTFAEGLEMNIQGKEVDLTLKSLPQRTLLLSVEVQGDCI